MRTFVQRLRGSAGQVSSEYLGVLLVVAVIIATVVVAGPGPTISARLEQLICQIAGGDCAAPEDDDPCTVSSSGREANLNLQILAVDLGQGGSYLREDRSDDTTVFTISDNASIQAALRAGAKARVGNVGFEATAEAAAGGRLEGAQQFTVPTDEADDLEEALRRQGGFGQIVRDNVESGPLGFAIDPLNDEIFGEDEPDLPEPSSEYVSADAYAGASGAAGATAGPVGGAEIEAALEAAGGARLITSGEDEGNLELYIQLDGSVAGSLSAATLGPGGSGDVSGVAVLTLEDGTTPTELALTLSTGYTGSLNIAQSAEGADLGSLSRVLEEASAGGSAGSGQSLEFGAKLDLTTPENRDAALGLITRGLGGVPGLVRRFDEDGNLTLQTADVDESEFEAGANVGLGINLGADGGESSSDSETTSALIRRPGDLGFQRRECG